EAKLAIEHGADYIGVGPMFPTSSKEDAREAGGPAMIKEMRDKGIDIPIVAIGGISLGNIQPIMEAGADGISIISAIAGSEAPSKSAHQLYKEVLQG
ncbi:MAG TPA: thiamine phosphate synthase, partial [Chondromyces sp.]|nr:thiamine phosphate synthase [Chondromyces sp.]